MTTKTLPQLSIAFNEDTEWDFVGPEPTVKGWLDISEALKPQVMAVDNGIGYYEYGSICATHTQIEPEVQDEGETLNLTIKIAGNMLDWTPEEVVKEILDTQDYIPNSYQWSTPHNEVSCEFELECIKAKYSPDHHAIIAEIGYVEA